MISRSAILGSAMLALTAAESAPLLETALEVVSRASTSSEVLSLNLTNLIILIALKVAIVVFGLVSGGGVTGRSGEAPTSVSTSVQLDLHDVGLLLSATQDLHLGVDNNTDGGAVHLHLCQLLLDLLLTEIISPLGAGLSEGLLLGLRPVLVEPSLGLFSNVL